MLAKDKDITLSKSNSKIYIREWIFPLLFVVFALVLEMVNFLTLGIGVLPTYLTFDIAVLFIFLGILFLMKTGGVAWICVASFFLLIQVGLNIANATLYGVFGDVFSLSMITLGTEGANAFKLEFLDFLSIFLNLFIYVTFILTCVYLKKNTNFTITLSKQAKFTIVMSFFIALSACGLCLFSGQASRMTLKADSNEESFSDKELWENMFLKTECLQRFGTYGFYLKNLGDFLFTDGKMSKEEQAKVKDALAQGENYVASSQYSGIAQGDNLIYIMLESFDTFSIDPVYTPFLWKMRTGQMAGAQYMDKFYAKNKTNISEEISFLGHVANEKLYASYQSSVGLNQPYSLPNLIKKDGATSVNFFHGYEESFYGRNKVNVSLGFDDVYGMDDSTLTNKSKEFEDWILDSDYIANMVEKIIPENQRFFSYYTTISTHGPYNYNNKRIKANLNYVNEHWREYEAYAQGQGNIHLNMSKSQINKLKQFKAFTMDTDKMVKYIFETLEQKGLLDTTTIVMFADHNAYYSNLCFDVKGTKKDDYANTESNHLPCFIYNNELPASVNNTFCNTYDLYPTICDLMGLRYNNTLTKGYSIYIDNISDSVFVSSLNGMYVENIFTSDLEEIILLDNSVTQEEINKFRRNLFKYFEKQKIIESIYRYNYFGKYA